jgi:phage terminase large subunit-like protein
MAAVTYSARAEKYARDVVGGRIPACEWVRLACARHLGDLKRSRAKGKAKWKYEYDPASGDRVCAFVERLPHTKGRWARDRQKLVLEPWQVFLTCCIFGWVHRATGLRRFRRVFLLIPRKNGKSALAAAWGLYMLVADGEHGAEVFSGATTEKQAWEVFRPARLMAVNTPQLRSFYGVTVNAASVHRLGDGSRFEPIIGDPGDGSSPSCAIHDEYHEHDTDAQVDAMLTGMGARDQPLQLVISTAGVNTAGPCYSAQLEAQKVLSGVAENDELFACIWTVDAGDDWTKLETLKKANPNYGVSVSAEFLQSRLQEAKNNARKQGIFQTKHLNVWVNAKQAYFNLHKWNLAANPRLDVRQGGLQRFKGRDCVIALDLASKVDLCSLTLLFRNHDGGRGQLGPQYTTFTRFYLPSETVEEPQNEHYQEWENEGRLEVTEGAVTNYAAIKEDLLLFCEWFVVEMVAYDPFQATMLVGELQDEGVPVVEFRQTVLNFSEPMKELDGLIRAGLIEHDGDPVQAWCISNVVAKADKKDNVYPNKERDEAKIDGAVSLIMAIGADMNGDRPPRSVYQDRGLVEIEA